MAEIQIVVGTESGNAQMVAEYLVDELGALGHRAKILDQAKADPVSLERNSVVLICTATHGDGELPDNLIPFHDRLAASRPNLAQLRYGVIALGDQTYKDTFCRAGKTIDALFQSLGAVRVGERLEIDACTQPLPDEEAAAWAREWVTLL